MTTRDEIAAIVADEAHGGDPFDIADAIIAELPGMIPDLVWNETHHKSPDQLDTRSSAIGVNYVIITGPKVGSCILSSHGAAYIGPFRMDGIESAKAAANVHNRATVCKAMGLS